MIFFRFVGKGFCNYDFICKKCVFVCARLFL